MTDTHTTPAKRLRDDLHRIVIGVFDSAIPEPWEVTDHAVEEILAIPAIARAVAAPVDGEVEELQRLFDLRWDADMRAIKRWQEANPENDLVWPDHADLVVWLLTRLAEAERERDEAVARITSLESENTMLVDCMQGIADALHYDTPCGPIPLDLEEITPKNAIDMRDAARDALDEIIRARTDLLDTKTTEPY